MDRHPAVAKLTEAVMRLIEDSQQEGGLIRDRLEDVIEMHYRPLLEVKTDERGNLTEVGIVHEALKTIEKNQSKRIIAGDLTYGPNNSISWSKRVDEASEAFAKSLMPSLQDFETTVLAPPLEAAADLMPIDVANEMEHALARDDALFFGNGFLSVTVNDGEYQLQRLDPKDIRIDRAPFLGNLEKVKT